jgi:sialidase-1
MLARSLCLSTLTCLLLLHAVAASGSPATFELFDVFSAGRDGYHTYRIPAAVVTTKGTVLLFCEGRKKSRSDAGDIDLLLKRSEDGGVTWSAAQIVHEEGGDAEITIGNPCPVVDRSDGTVHLLFSRENARAFHTTSTDDGITWSTPREITAAFKGFDFPWSRLGTGPVHGIQLASGRLIAPVWLNEKKGANYRSAVLFSDDHGATWKTGGLAGPEVPETNECVVFDTKEGTLCLNMRASHTKERAVAWSSDAGLTWSPSKPASTLPAPVCQASALRLGKKHSDWVLFSAPAGPGRANMTIRLSQDGGKTWPLTRCVSENAAAYSDLAEANDGWILCFHERGVEGPYESIRLMRFTPEWLTSTKN